MIYVLYVLDRYLTGKGYYFPVKVATFLSQMDAVKYVLEQPGRFYHDYKRDLHGILIYSSSSMPNRTYVIEETKPVGKTIEL